MDQNRTQKITIGFLILAVVVGIIIGFANTDDVIAPTDEKVFVDDANTATQEKVVNTVKTVEVKDISISVQNQNAGDAVIVSSVTFEKESWVAVREDRNGELWSILGARRLPPGTHTNVTVPLLRNTIPGTLYHVVAYEEDGDMMFDHKSDTLISKGEAFYIVDFTTL